MKEVLATILYQKVKFKFICNHWDLHLSGSCIYDGELCEFKTLEGDWNEEKNEWDDSFCEIYKLNWIQKVKFILRQKKFEWMVGYHWTYPANRGKRSTFYYRNPQWLYRLLFKLYFRKFYIRKKHIASTQQPITKD